MLSTKLLNNELTPLATAEGSETDSDVDCGAPETAIPVGREATSKAPSFLDRVAPGSPKACIPSALLGLGPTAEMMGARAVPGNSVKLEQY